METKEDNFMDKLAQKFTEQEKETELKAKKDLEFLTGILDEKFRDSDEFVHKESVKVYRNVQAVVIDELKKQTDIIIEDSKSINKKSDAKLNIVMALSIVSIIISVLNILLSVF